MITSSSSKLTRKFISKFSLVSLSSILGFLWGVWLATKDDRSVNNE